MTADEWYYMGLFSIVSHNRRMAILGALTQSQACAQRGDCTMTIDPGQHTDSTPEMGWQKLWDALNKDPQTAFPLRYLTDIKYDE